jgi:hypothetical protein
MEPVLNSNDNATVYSITCNRFGRLKGRYIYIEKNNNVINIKVKPKLLDQSSCQNRKLALPKDLECIFRYYLQNEGKESKKLLKIINKIMSDSDKAFMLSNVLQESIDNIEILYYLKDSNKIYEFFKNKCINSGMRESVVFIENCLEFFQTPTKENAQTIVYQHLDPDSIYQINVGKVDSVFPVMCKLLQNFELNKTAIAAQITAYLQEILRLLYKNLPMG